MPILNQLCFDEVCGIIYLRFVEHFLGDFALEDLGRTGLFQDLVLAKGKEAFEEVLGE